MAIEKSGAPGASKGKKSAKSKATKSTKGKLSVSKTAKSSKTNNVTAISSKTMPVTSGQRQQMIETAAYLIAEKRGFIGGNSTEDWISAEKQIDAYLNSESGDTAVA